MCLHDLVDGVVLVGEEDRSQRDDALQLARRIDDIADVDGLFVRTGAADTLERVLDGHIAL